MSPHWRSSRWEVEMCEADHNGYHLVDNAIKCHSIASLLHCTHLHKCKAFLLVYINIDNRITLQRQSTSNVSTPNHQLDFATSKSQNTEFYLIPGPAVLPPTAAITLLKKVAMDCSFVIGGSPPTYTLRACLVAWIPSHKPKWGEITVTSLDVTNMKQEIVIHNQKTKQVEPTN